MVTYVVESKVIWHQKQNVWFRGFRWAPQQGAAGSHHRQCHDPRRHHCNQAKAPSSSQQKHGMQCMTAGQLQTAIEHCMREKAATMAGLAVVAYMSCLASAHDSVQDNCTLPIPLKNVACQGLDSYPDATTSDECGHNCCRCVHATCYSFSEFVRTRRRTRAYHHFTLDGMHT